MKLQSVRIKTNDFPEDQKELAESLGGILNPFIDKLVIGFNKNFTVDDNLPFEFKILDTRVDASGIPEINSALTTNLKNLKGYICINMSILDRGDSGFAEFLGTEEDDTLITESGDNIGLSTPGLFPLAAPFLTTETIGNMSYIRHIAGLKAGVNYRLILLAIS
jgi:hypothetical protein